MYKLSLIILTTVATAFAALGQQQAARPYFTEPSLSPDRKEIAFVSGGDIWTAPSTGGVAALLVSVSSNEARHLLLTDGRTSAHISSLSRSGHISSILPDYTPTIHHT